MNIIFATSFGVVSKWHNLVAGGYYDFDPESVANLKDVLDHTKSHLVITDQMTSGDKTKITQLAFQLLQNNIILFGALSYSNRSQGITEWITQHGKSLDIKRTIVLDTSVSAYTHNLAFAKSFIEQSIGYKVVQVSTASGLTRSYTFDMVRFLNGINS